MSYTELESGYQGLRQNQPGFYVGRDGNIVSFVSVNYSNLTIDLS